MGSRLKSIISMNHIMGAREMNMAQKSTINISENDATLNAYKALFGSAALRELYEAKNHDWQATIAACLDLVSGNKHGMVTGGARGLVMTTSVSNGE